MADWKDRIEGNRIEFSGKVKPQWGKLSDDDLTQIKGNRQELERRIQKHYGTDLAAAQTRSTSGLRPGVDQIGGPFRRTFFVCYARIERVASLNSRAAVLGSSKERHRSAG